MGKVKGPDLMVIEAESLRASAWLPTARVIEFYEWPMVFGNDRAVEIELGSGDGGFIVERARQFPLRNFLAVERLLGRARKIVKKIQRAELDNLKVLRLESSYVLKRLVPEKSVSTVHIMFPDPWPKKRHHKRRLIQPGFLKSAHRVLLPEGTVRFSTDDPDYFAWTSEIWAAQPGWKALPVWDFQNDPKSEFQVQWEDEGKETFRLHYQWAPSGE